MAQFPRIPVNSNSSQLRAIYNSIVESGQYSQDVITYSYLRSEIQLSASQGTINFPILVSDTPTANANEKRLNIGDSFQCTSMGIFIYKTPTGEAISGQNLDTFPNPITYSRGSGAESKALMSLYNGFFAITINRTEIIPAMDCYQFLNIGDAQKGVLTAASGTNNAYVANAFFPDFGMVELLPSVPVAGNVVNQFQLTPSQSADMTGTSSTNTIVLLLRGFLIQGGAKVGQK